MRIPLRPLAMLLSLITAAAACGDAGGPAQNVSDSLSGIPALTSSITSAGNLLPGSSLMAGDMDGLTPGVSVRGLLTFDLGSIPPGNIVRMAKIRLFQRDVTGTPYTDHGDIILDHVTTGGSLDSADFSDGALDSAFAVLSTDSTRGIRIANVFQQVQADIAAGRTVSQFRLRFSNEDGDNDGIDDRADFNTLSDAPPPLIILTYQD